MLPEKNSKALFLDRDGVINKEVDFLYRIEDLEYIPGIFELCIEFQKRGYLIFVITNQSGIARGYFTEKEFQILKEQIHSDFEKQGIMITKTYHCPHLPEITGDCKCRKPKPGMILQARDEFDLDLKRSVLIGDSRRDIEAGKRAEIKKCFFYGEDLVEKAENLQVNSLMRVVDLIQDF